MASQYTLWRRNIHYDIITVNMQKKTGRNNYKTDELSRYLYKSERENKWVSESEISQIKQQRPEVGETRQSAHFTLWDLITHSNQITWWLNLI